MQPLPRKSTLYPCLFILAMTSTHADAVNHLVNGDFATDVSGWTFTQSSPFDIVFWTSALGTPPHQGGTSGGSLNLTAMPNSSITASQCVAMTGNAINASILVFPFVTAGPSTVQVIAFASGDCSGDALGTTPLAPAGADMAWIRYQALEAPLAQGTGSVRFEITVSDDANQSTGDYLFDDAQLDAPAIFVDGFESGSGSGN